MNDVSDACMAMGEGTIEKISEFKEGIEPKTDVMPLAKEGKNGIKWNIDINKDTPKIYVEKPGKIPAEITWRSTLLNLR